MCREPILLIAFNICNANPKPEFHTSLTQTIGPFLWAMSMGPNPIQVSLITRPHTLQLQGQRPSFAAFNFLPLARFPPLAPQTQLLFPKKEKKTGTVRIFLLLQRKWRFYSSLSFSLKFFKNTMKIRRFCCLLRTSNSTMWYVVSCWF